jgi:signal transduction histidine kinase/CheY-like chemotaxis protein
LLSEPLSPHGPSSQDVWSCAPVAAVHIAWLDGQASTQLNAHAARWATQVGVHAADWQALARSVLAEQAQPRIVLLGNQAIRCTPVVTNEGVLVWLEPMHGVGASGLPSGDGTAAPQRLVNNGAQDSESIRRERDRIEQARLDSVDFMARVSHELRTPLNAVLGFARLIEDDLLEPATPRQRERLNWIANGGNRLLTLVDDLLELGRLESEASSSDGAAPATLTSAAQALQEAVNARTEQARGLGVEIDLNSGPAGLQVWADQRRLVRALSLMLEHTVRRSAVGTRVQVRAQAVETGDKAWARFVLQDGGPGLTPEQQLWMFEPFAPYQGSGAAEDASPLQLSLARRLVQALGGRVLATGGSGAAGQGIEIRMELPCAPLDESVPEAEPALAASLEILCVEDNPVNLQLVRELVALRPGVVLRTAIDAASALVAASERAPDVFLLDMHLPDLHGLQLMQRLRAQWATARCIYVALSADVLPQNVERALGSGFDEYWTKPIDFQAFLRGLDRLAARRR